MSDGVTRTSSTRLDNYVDRYAARTRGMTASEIRALFSVASRPEVVSLAGGMPNISGLPLDVVGGAISDLVRDRGPVAMQYGSGQGDPAHPDDVVVTVGSQQAVDLVTRIFCDPGDVVICEAPSYVGALGVFRAYECDVVHVEMDAHGLVPSVLADAIASVQASGRRIKFLYTIPNFHNPAGVTLADERRREVLEICREADVLILEDNPYGLLGFEGEPHRALRADEADGVIYLGSFSKTFAPGFRVGWALAPHAVREKLVLAQESATLCPPAFSQMAISAYLTAHDWQGQVKQFREMYRERRDAMIHALEDMMPAAARWNVPDGGFYVWLTLPDGLDAKAMLPRAVTARVAYVPGTAFFADGFGSQSMRLSYCYPTPERIREGVRRLVGVIEEELELRATFGAGGRAFERGLERGYEAPNTDLT
jgi:2-aminoadipate transaminase